MTKYILYGHGGSYNHGVEAITKCTIELLKKINPDSITKTVNNVQKLMALVAGIGAANTFKAAKGNKLTGDPLFDKKFDDWY